MTKRTHEDIYKDYKIEYHIIKHDSGLVEGTTEIHGPICSTATTKSTKSDLSFLEFNNETEALKALKKMAEKRIDEAEYFHIYNVKTSIGENKCSSCGKIIQN
ncbi:Uncharacterised protein [Legionella steigerwaltii]|uniref:Uncharacterized protein n=1 Tax=Legionella steigerwaltii TaxID=460 RepID=A0A378LCV2_9GAMM|nr:hypothetical protein [Legionella steigerwaltii]KTD78969.1 hypothetical protein Lstg_0926 [Legionella steigerwaltii]STY23559.1 Uncharacterised protein [Legionella steigerwaltii]